MRTGVELTPTRLPLPIVLDTDIGTDIDDAYALILAAASPELDLRVVTTVNNDVELRARIAKSLLRRMGRDDVPVALGCGAALTPGVSRGWEGHEGRGIDLADVEPSRDFDPRPAHHAIAEVVAAGYAAGRPVSVVTIGALTNLAVALREHPAEMRLARGVIAMASNFAGYGEESAKGEHNVACDPVAMEEVLRCGLPLWIIGLNVTCQTSMTRARMEALAAIGGPLAEGVCGMHRVWLDFVRRDSSPMHDGLAVATAFRPDLVELAPATSPGLRPPIERGAVMYESAGPNAPTRITADLHADAFHALLFERVTAAVENAKRQMQSA